MLYIGGQARAAARGRVQAGRVPRLRPGLARGPERGAPPAGARGRGGATVQGLPLIKPPYDRHHRVQHEHRRHRLAEDAQVDADEIKNHQALRGLNLPRLGQPGRTFIGILATKTLVIAGEGGVHTNENGKRIALLRAYDKQTGEDAGAVDMPKKQTGSPMTYTTDGKQYIVLAVSGTTGRDPGVRAALVVC